MPKVAIRCKASLAEGMGHVYRQTHLGSVLRQRDWEVSFFVTGFPPALELLTRSGFHPHTVEPKTPLPEETDGPFDLVIVDLQDTTEAFIHSLKKHARRIAGFEDLGPGRHHLDLLIDCNLDPSESGAVSPGVNALFGPDYSVLHPDFAIYHDRPRVFGDSLQSVLISLGATDPKHLTLPLTQILLREKPGLSITVLTGTDCPDHSQLKELALQSPSLKLPGHITQMAQTLWNHQLVVCAGGVTLHEALAVGTPALVINQVEHQQTKALFMERFGAAVNLGLERNYDAGKLREALGWGKSELEPMSRKGKELIDGRGIHRVVEEIYKLIS